MLFHWLLALIHSRLGFWLLATGCIYFRVSTFGGIAKISQIKMTTFFADLLNVFLNYKVVPHISLYIVNVYLLFVLLSR